MHHHRKISSLAAAALAAVLLVPALAGAGPIGELAGQVPVVGPIVDPDGDGNAELPVLSEDTCAGHDDAVDQDGDATPDGCDADRDGDSVDNGDDLWPDDPSQTVDSDGDGVSDERDACAGHDDAVDQDADGIPDACDADRDGDGVDNGDDLWPDDPSQTVDSDGDGVSDERDACAGHDDRVDQDADGIPDGCDDDRDGDGVANDDDFRSDDPERWSDLDLDGVADQHDDVCLGHDDAIDQDSDGMPDGCDVDRDGDGVDNGDDLWPDDPSQTVDSDGDGISDERDACHGHDDAIDQDSDGTPDGCDDDRDGDGVDNGNDLWPDDPSQTLDSDGDGISDERDVCDGLDDAVDQDGDGTPDGCDADRDGDGVDNEHDPWPDDPSRSEPHQGVPTHVAQFRAGNAAIDKAAELSVAAVDGHSTDGQHAWTNGGTSPLRLAWTPPCCGTPDAQDVFLSVGSSWTELVGRPAEQMRTLRIEVHSASPAMTATLTDLAINGVPLASGSLVASGSTVSIHVGAAHWEPGVELTGQVTFSYTGAVPKNNELSVTLVLGR